MSFEMTTSVTASNQVFTSDDIQNEISSDVSKVQLLLEVNSSYALTLLLKFKWDIDVLKESFHASRSLSDFLVSNKVCRKTRSVAIIPRVCHLCLEIVDVKGLECRHMACGTCWKMYLKNKIESGNPSIECFNCSLLICNHKLETFLGGDTELLTVYQKLVVNSYVNNVSNFTWCSKACGNAVKNTGSSDVTCSCGVKFCFHCHQDPHTPASCDQVQLWDRACEEYRDKGNKKSVKWIRKNTQSCPRCLAPIEKNGGCIHMHCSKCKYDFCWNCRDIWNYSDHGYMCGFPKLRIVRANKPKIDPYLLPFQYHKQILDNTNDSSSLSECRRVLMYSYVYSYYQEPEKVEKGFKQLQKKLKIELDLEKSRQNLEKCEQLRKSVLDYCYLHPRGEEVGKRKRNGCCNFIFVVFVVLLLCCVLAAVFTAIVSFVM